MTTFLDEINSTMSQMHILIQYNIFPDLDLSDLMQKSTFTKFSSDSDILRTIDFWPVTNAFVRGQKSIVRKIFFILGQNVTSLCHGFS